MRKRIKKEVKVEGKRTFTYRVNGLDFKANETLAELLKKLKATDGVTAAEFDYEAEDVTYAIDEWASEYDVLTAVMALFSEIGAELVLDGDGTETLESKGFTEEVNEEEIKPEEEPKKSVTREKKEERRSDLAERIVVLGISFVLMIVGLFMKKHETARMWIYMIGFVFAGYATFYTAIEKIAKKEYIGEEAIVTLSSLAFLYLGYQATGCFAMFLYAFLNFARFIGNGFAEKKIDGISEAIENAETEEERALLRGEKEYLDGLKARRDAKAESLKKKKVICNLVFLGAGVLVAFVPPLFHIGSYGDLLTSRWLYTGLGIALFGTAGAYFESVAGDACFFAIGLFGKKIYCNCGEETFDRLAEVKKVAFDGKGVLTERSCSVVGVTGDREKTLRLFSLAIKGSKHPLAALADENAEGEVSERKERENKGVVCLVDGKTVVAGNKKFAEENGIEVPAYEGENTPVYIAKDGRFTGMLEVLYRVKENAAGAVRELAGDLGVSSVLVSSDCNSAVSALGKKVGIARSYSGASSAYKVKTASEEGTLYVGDNGADDGVKGKCPLAVGMNGIAEKGVSLSDGEIRSLPGLLKSCIARKKAKRANKVAEIAGKAILLALFLALKLTGKADALWLILPLAALVDLFALFNAFRFAKSR